MRTTCTKYQCLCDWWRTPNGASRWGHDGHDDRDDQRDRVQNDQEQRSF